MAYPQNLRRIQRSPCGAIAREGLAAGLLVSLLLCTGAPSHAAVKPVFQNVVCEGDYQHHLQGVCTNETDGIYWSFTTALVKTNRLGRILKNVPVANHHGDLCFHNGRLFVAVNHGRFNDPQGHGDSWVYVYNAGTLTFLSKHPTPEVFHGAGGIGVVNGRFYVVGGLSEGVNENYVYEYDADFRFVKKHVVKSGWTRLGIQTAAFHEGAWWFGCYGNPKVLLKTDASFQLLGRYEFDGSLGIVGVGKNRLLVAKGPRTKEGRCLGSLHLSRPDDTKGLVLVPRTDSVLDTQRVLRTGTWSSDSFRYAASSHLHTTEEKASLEYQFEGTGISVRLGGHNVPCYGPPNLGSIAISIDDGQPRLLRPRSLPREVLVADGLPHGSHSVRMEHQNDGELTGCRVESFQTWSDARGELQFHVSGDENAFLVDCRAILRQGETIVRHSLVRNWMTGQCSLTALPPGDGYSLEVRATGWQTFHTEEFNIAAGKPTELPPVYLRRDAATVRHRFRFPRMNQPAVCKPGKTFRARFLGFGATIDEVRLTRQVGPAVISRVVAFKEDNAARYYYDREVVVTLPDDMPTGLFDLAVHVTGGRRTGICRSPRSVQVMQQYPIDPVFVTFGHLDTSAQYQAEYLEWLVTIVNLLAPDGVLCSNAVNPAYISGALAGLDMPFAINFGNHQFSGHEAWFGDPVGLVDFGPHVTILNFGHAWHTDRSRADFLLGSRPKTAVKVINAFEANAPLALLNRHQVRMLHFAHGPGKRVENVGTTPTRRIGKHNAASFRIVRFRDNQVVSCTYNGHATEAIPFVREAPPPLNLTFTRPNDGTHAVNKATITNRLQEAYRNARVTFVVPAGKYRVTGGQMESNIHSDDARFSVLRVRANIPRTGSIEITATRLP